jgi:hypothetical protein
MDLSTVEIVLGVFIFAIIVLFPIIAIPYNKKKYGWTETCGVIANGELLCFCTQLRSSDFGEERVHIEEDVPNHDNVVALLVSSIEAGIDSWGQFRRYHHLRCVADGTNKGGLLNYTYTPLFLVQLSGRKAVVVSSVPNSRLTTQDIGNTFSVRYKTLGQRKNGSNKHEDVIVNDHTSLTEAIAHVNW